MAASQPSLFGIPEPTVGGSEALTASAVEPVVPITDDGRSSARRPVKPPVPKCSGGTTPRSQRTVTATSHKALGGMIDGVHPMTTTMGVEGDFAALTMRAATTSNQLSTKLQQTGEVRRGSGAGPSNNNGKKGEFIPSSTKILSQTKPKSESASKAPQKEKVKKVVVRRRVRPNAPLSPKKDKTPPPLPALSQEESRHLKRVFDHMAGLTRRRHLNKGLERCMDRMLRLQEYIKYGGASMDPSITCLSTQQAEAQIAFLTDEMSRLKLRITKLKDDPKKTISCSDLSETLRLLGYSFPQKQLEYIIWEADDNMDGVIDRQEFDRTFLRNMADDTSHEPRELFNIIQFLTLDESMKGRITEDETIGILFARYGGDRIETIMLSLFGDRLKTRGGPGLLLFSEYLERVGVRLQPEAFKAMMSRVQGDEEQELATQQPSAVQIQVLQRRQQQQQSLTLRNTMGISGLDFGAPTLRTGALTTSRGETLKV